MSLCECILLSLPLTILCPPPFHIAIFLFLSLPFSLCLSFEYNVKSIVTLKSKIKHQNKRYRKLQNKDNDNNCTATKKIFRILFGFDYRHRNNCTQFIYFAIETETPIYLVHIEYFPRYRF